MPDQSQTLRDAARLLAPVVQVYDRRVRKYGANPQGVFWKNEAWQQIRFQTLSAIFDDADQAGGLTIHDFGCGYGAFFHYLKDLPVMHMSRFIGTDMSQPLIEAARTSTTDPRAQFVRRLHATETADYTFASGTFNMHMGADGGEWVAYVQACLSQLWGRTRKGLAFNMLRLDAPEKFRDLYYADENLFRDFCARNLSADLTLTNDDPLPDWTLLVRRRRGQDVPG